MAKQTIVEGQTATNRKTGDKIIYQGGKWYPYNTASGGADIPTGGAVKATEDQGKTQGYARLMAEAERQYQRSVQKGYNYKSARNAFADQLETPAPGIGAPLGGFAPLLRDDAADEATKAKKAWQDAQLKAMTGAGQSQPEQVENPKTYFPQYGEGAGAAQNAETIRATAYESARRRAGPHGLDLPNYWPRKEKPAAWWSTLPKPQADTARRFKGSAARPGTPDNPFVPGDEAEYNALPPGSTYIHSSGVLKRKGGG